MPILTLLKQVKNNCKESPHPVVNEAMTMRNCYLTGLAMQAYADGDVTPEERRYFLEMASFFKVPQNEAIDLLQKAREPSEQVVQDIRRALINSKHKYYFILDLQIMAHQDQMVKSVEAQVIRRFGEILDVEEKDFKFLVELADAVAEEDPEAKARWEANFCERPRLDSSQPVDFTHYVK